MFNPKPYLLLVPLLLVALLAGCGGGGNVGSSDPGVATMQAVTEIDTAADKALPPAVLSTIPAAAATDVATNRKLTATFSYAMDPATITTETFAVRQGGIPVIGTVTYAHKTAVFTPTYLLASNTAFTASLNRGIRNRDGRALADRYVWSFRTGATRDITPYEVSSTIPTNGAKNVATYKPISVTFSEPISPATINETTFTLLQGASTVPVPGTVTYVHQTATFTPTHNLAPQFLYTATIKTGVSDLAGNASKAAFVWRFNTGLDPVALRSAGSFAVLAGSTVTNSALLTTVNGDLGVSPGTAVTGFPPGVVNGTMHKGDPIAAQAKLDLTRAYNDAAGRSRAPVTVAGNLGGMTLYPGLYKSTSSLEISSGNLTLDARGDADAVFVFEMASTLTTTSGRQIILSGNAKASNIFWQVGSSATLGSTSVFKGSILAAISITVQTGATVDGRLLTRTGAVTLDGNTINRP